MGRQRPRGGPRRVALAGLLAAVATLLAGTGGCATQALTLPPADRATAPTTAPVPSDPGSSPQLDALGPPIAPPSPPTEREQMYALLPEGLATIDALAAEAGIPAPRQFAGLRVSGSGIDADVRLGPDASAETSFSYRVIAGTVTPDGPRGERPSAGPWFTLDGVNLGAPESIRAGVSSRAPGSTVDEAELEVNTADGLGLVWEVRATVPDGIAWVVADPSGRVLEVRGA